VLPAIGPRVRGTKVLRTIKGSRTVAEKQSKICFGGVITSTLQPSY